ncbi:hypothetical protein SNEBB_005728 [Seison nebaliae]|nr:hypothetical protein SNEBB_005728 [Seison nebaliae]
MRLPNYILKNFRSLSLNANINSIEPKLTLWKRFKQAYKQHGKLIIITHCATSAFWFTSFYTIFSNQVTSPRNVLKRMEALNYIEVSTGDKIRGTLDHFDSEKILKLTRIYDYMSDGTKVFLKTYLPQPRVEALVGMFLLYKTLTPLRYATTLACFRVVLRYYKKSGKMPKHPPKGDSLKELARESRGRIQRKFHNLHDRWNSKRLLRHVIAKQRLGKKIK